MQKGLKFLIFSIDNISVGVLFFVYSVMAAITAHANYPLLLHILNDV